MTTHLVSAAPTGWLVEYFTGGDPAAAILEEPPAVEDGHVHLPGRPGHGYRLDRDAVAEFAVRSDIHEGLTSPGTARREVPERVTLF